MRRIVLSIAVLGAFSFMLVGTSKPKEDGKTTPITTATASAAAVSTTSATASAEASATPASSASIPSTADWQDTKIALAKVALKIPKGAKAPPDRSGSDATMGTYFTVVMPSGYGVYVKAPRKPDVVASTKTFYKTNARGSIQTIFDADDAVVANRKESGPAGSYCEVTACSPAVRGKPLCAESAGALVEGSKVTKLTADECFAVVAMLRSVKAWP